MDKYEIKCCCGQYKATFDNEAISHSAAEMHVMLGAQHVVTCYIREHNQKVAANHVVFVVRGKEQAK